MGTLKCYRYGRSFFVVQLGNRTLGIMIITRGVNDVKMRACPPSPNVKRVCYFLYLTVVVTIRMRAPTFSV